MAICNQSAVLCRVFGAAVASTPVMLRPKTEQYRNGNLQSICRSGTRPWRCSCQHSRHAPPQNLTVWKWQFAINLPFCAASLALQLPALPSCSAPKLNSTEMAICNQSAVLCGVLGAAVASTLVMLAPKLNIRKGNLQSICPSVRCPWPCSCQHSRHAPPPKLNIRNGNLQSICRAVRRLWCCSRQRSRHAPPQN